MRTFYKKIYPLQLAESQQEAAIRYQKYKLESKRQEKVRRKTTRPRARQPKYRRPKGCKDYAKDWIYIPPELVEEESRPITPEITPAEKLLVDLKEAMMLHPVYGKILFDLQQKRMLALSKLKSLQRSQDRVNSPETSKNTTRTSFDIKKFDKEKSFKEWITKKREELEARRDRKYKLLMRINKMSGYQKRRRKLLTAKLNSIASDNKLDSQRHTLSSFESMSV